VSSDNPFALAAINSSDDFMRGFIGGHTNPTGQGIIDVFMHVAAIVGTANVGIHKAGEIKVTSMAADARSWRIASASGAYCKLAHGVRRSAGQGDMSRYAADQNQLAVPALQFIHSCIDGIQHADTLVSNWRR